MPTMLLFLWVPSLWAMMSSQDYVSALKLLDQDIKTRKSSVWRPSYQRGEHWEVAAFRQHHTLMRMISDPNPFQTQRGTLGIFRYEVTQENVLQITQVDAYGVPQVDPRIVHLDLKINDRFLQFEKIYSFRNTSSGLLNRMTRSIPVAVSPEGIRSRITPLEFFPLDVPDLTGAQPREINAIPELPQELKDIVERTGYPMNDSKSQWFELSDFFGRPIQILWQPGDPWPTYMKTPNGIAILISKGRT